MSAFRHCVSAFVLAVCALPAAAHKSSEAYLTLDAGAQSVAVRFDIALRDLDAALDLDADGDRALTVAEVRSAWPRIDALALGALGVAGCKLDVTGHAFEERSDGVYAVLQLTAPCVYNPAAPLRYSLFATLDPTHRGVARINHADGATAVLVLDPGAAVATAPYGTSTGSGSAAMPSLWLEGVHHIITGYDHLLFLLCLLLPAVLHRSGSGWQPVATWRAALLPVLGIVTLFTLAHSLTLGLAASGLVQLSPAFIEPAIAATIALAALDNIWPFLGRWRAAVTFGFGLIHGFGFASALGELELHGWAFASALFRFNLGLESGQVAAVLLVVPLLWLLRRRAAYVPAVLRGGSGLAAGMAAIWMFQRL